MFAILTNALLASLVDILTKAICNQCLNSYKAIILYTLANFLAKRLLTTNDESSGYLKLYLTDDEKDTQEINLKSNKELLKKYVNLNLYFIKSTEQRINIILRVFCIL